jgi:hypothetical protein
LDANEAAVLGKQPGEKVPLKLKNTASEIVNRGVHMVQANGRSIMADSRGNVIKDMGTANPIVLNQIQQGGFAATTKVPDGVTGEAALAYLDPNTAAAVRMIGDGKGDFQTFASRMNPQAKGNLGWIRSCLQSGLRPADLHGCQAGCRSAPAGRGLSSSHQWIVRAST